MEKYRFLMGVIVGGIVLIITAHAETANYTVIVSNERSGDVSIIDGVSHGVITTMRVGKRPRGIHAGPEGSTFWVAVSGSTVMGPGANPDRAKAPAADRSADGLYPEFL